jgi:hypothetical protein
VDDAEGPEEEAPKGEINVSEPPIHRPTEADVIAFRLARTSLPPRVRSLLFIPSHRARREGRRVVDSAGS